MTDAREAAERLLALGDARHHPASAVVGVRTPAGTDVAVAGWARLGTEDEPGVRMARELRLDLASVTKVASSTTMAMRLVADGELRLDALVSGYLPAFTAGGKDRITVEQLLTHTAGLQPWWPLYFETTDPDRAIERVEALDLAAEPGTVWRYSDLGFMLIGRVIERITGTSLADAFRQLVAEPLGLGARYGTPAAEAVTSGDSDAYEYTMVASGDPYPTPFRPEQFTGWRRSPIRGEVNDGNAAHALHGVSGHAGLFATVDELLELGTALRGGGLIPREVLDRFAAATPLHPEQAVGFRRSIWHTPRGDLTVLRHSGFTGTWLAVGIEQELVVAGGAMRLHGTLGPCRVGAGIERSGLVPTARIEGILGDAARAALDPSLAATPKETP